MFGSFFVQDILTLTFFCFILLGGLLLVGAVVHDGSDLRWDGPVAGGGGVGIIHFSDAQLLLEPSAVCTFRSLISGLAEAVVWEVEASS